MDNRHPAGTSVGGQWAPGSASEVDFDDAFDDLGYNATEPPQESTYGDFAPDDWQERPEMRGVRTKNERLGLGGFVHPEARSAIDSAFYNHVNEEITTDDLTYLQERHLPATSNAEIVDSLNNARDILADHDEDSDPNWQEAQGPLRDLVLRDQSRRGLGVDSSAVDIPDITSYGSGGGYAVRWDGGKYDREMTTKEAAANIRKDVKTAVDAGFLPEGFKYSVRTDNFAGGSAVRFSASPKEPMAEENFMEENDLNPYGEPLRSYEMTEMENRMSMIADSYRSDRSDMMTDLFNTNFYCHPCVHRD